MCPGVIVKGIKETLIEIDRKVEKKRNEIKKKCEEIKEDLLRKAEDNAPLQEGTLVGSGSAEVKDHGRGRGITISAGFDTPYAMRMHESHYQARPVKRGRKKKRKVTSGGISKTIRVGEDKDVSGKRHGKRGRKYLTRAWNENRTRYIQSLEAIGDRK